MGSRELRKRPPSLRRDPLFRSSCLCARMISLNFERGFASAIVPCKWLFKSSTCEWFAPNKIYARKADVEFERSLSLRSSNSQDLIFQELQGLKSLVELSLQVSLESRNSSIESLPDATTSSNSKISSNLRDLARAAQVFHSSASSTASTVAGSEAGDFTEFQRERIEGWRNDLGTIDEALEDRKLSKFP